MFSPELKSEIAEKIEEILRETNHPELSEGRVNFLLHVDGKESWSWANIVNNGGGYDKVPVGLIKNMSK